MPLVFEPVPCNEELRDLGIHVDQRDYRYDYPALSKMIIEETNNQNAKGAMDIFKKFAKDDMFFLGYFVLDLPINNPFLMARCYEIQDDNHFTIDLWSREHWKSTLVTYLYTIFSLIQNPEERIGIFSLNRTLAKSHMRKIKITLESNMLLKRIFPDIFYMNPGGQALKWSEDDGIYVKRTKTYGEASVEACGLIDAMPTGKHFTQLVFDDVVTETSVSTPGQIEKVDRQFKLAQNLGARGGKKRVVGTRYGARDVYGTLIGMKRWKERIYPAEVDSFGNAKRHGIPVLLTEKELDEKFDSQGEYIYSCQMLQNPVAISKQKLNEKWIKWYSSKEKPYMNYYLTIDPASSKKKGSDYTVMQVWGADPYRKLWLVDMVRDRMNLGEKWDAIRHLTSKWEIQDVGYEKYGMQADVEYFQEKMDESHYYLNIIELGGIVSKEDRIKKLIPYLQKGCIVLPRSMIYTTLEGKTVDLMIEYLEDEYKIFPMSKHDDMLDCSARILDSKMGVIYPVHKKERSQITNINDPLGLNDPENEERSWMEQ